MIWNTTVRANDRFSERIFDLLVQESRNADRVKSSFHAACVVNKKQILSIGLNRRKSHPLMSRFGSYRPNQIFLHAEVDAIVRTVNQYGNEILKESDIYVLRTTKAGNVAESRPCDGCMEVINAFGIKNIYWS